MTEKRQELLERINEGNVESVRGLSDDLDRDKASVSRGLDLLFEYERDGPRKIPKGKHETVLVRPLL
jgi:predicted transcriptional regulator